MNKTQFFIDEKIPYIELRYSKTKLNYKEHLHDDLSIGALISGKREYTNKNNKYIIAKDSLAIVNPNIIHSCNNITSEETSYYMLYIKKQWLFQIQKELNPVLDSFVPFSKEFLENKKEYEDFIKLCEVIFSSELYLEKEVLLLEFISNLYLNHCDFKIASKESYKTKVKDIREYLNKNISENISLDELSKKFNLSTFYIIKLFKKELGISVYSYFINLKIEYAKVLLKKGISIVETALECGFYDQSHLHRNFLKIVALTPKEYQDNFVQ